MRSKSLPQALSAALLALLLPLRLAGQEPAPSSAAPLPLLAPTAAAPDGVVLPPLTSPAAVPDGIAERPALTLISPPGPDPAALARTLAAGDRPPVLERPTHLEVPYGYETPTLRCAPLRVCALELEDGEIVLNTLTGDSERWLIDKAAAGPAGRTPILAIKPTDCDLTTNLVVTTDRRLYQILLSAPPCPDDRRYDPRARYTPLLRFYYPDALVREWSSAESVAAAAAAEEARNRIPLASTVPLTELNFRYRWQRSRFPWVPETVFDDGEHTYIRLPAAASKHPTPILLLLRGRGASDLLNYSYRPGPAGTAYFVTDRVLDRAALVIGTGRGQRRLTLVNSALAR